MTKALRYSLLLLSGVILCSIATAVVQAETVELTDGTVYSGKIASDLGARIGFTTDDGKFILIEKSKIKKPTKEKKTSEDDEADESKDGVGTPEEKDAVSSASTQESKDAKARAALRRRAISQLRGHAATDFTAKDLAGNEITLSDYRGKIVFLVFWATWCPSCVEELPNEKKILEKYKDKGFTIISVSQDLNRELLERFIKQNRLEWTQIQDKTDKVGEISKLYKVWSLPQSYLIDQKGTIRFRDLTGNDLEEAVAALLGIPPID